MANLATAKKQEPENILNANERLTQGQEEARKAHEKAKNNPTDGQVYSAQQAENLGYVSGYGISPDLAMAKVSKQDFSLSPGGAQMTARAATWEASNNRYEAMRAMGYKFIPRGPGEEPIAYKPKSEAELRAIYENKISNIEAKIANAPDEYLHKVEGGFAMIKDGEIALTNAQGFYANKAKTDPDNSEKWADRAERAKEESALLAQASRERREKFKQEQHEKRCKDHGFDYERVAPEALRSYLKTKEHAEKGLVKAQRNLRLSNNQLAALNEVCGQSPGVSPAQALANFKPRMLSDAAVAKARQEKAEMQVAKATPEAPKAIISNPEAKQANKAIVADSNKEASIINPNALTQLAATSIFNLSRSAQSFNWSDLTLPPAPTPVTAQQGEYQTVSLVQKTTVRLKNEDLYEDFKKMKEGNSLPDVSQINFPQSIEQLEKAKAIVENLLASNHPITASDRALFQSFTQFLGEAIKGKGGEVKEVRKVMET